MIGPARFSTDRLLLLLLLDTITRFLCLHSDLQALVTAGAAAVLLSSLVASLSASREGPGTMQPNPQPEPSQSQPQPQAGLLSGQMAGAQSQGRRRQLLRRLGSPCVGQLLQLLLDLLLLDEQPTAVRHRGAATCSGRGAGEGGGVDDTMECTTPRPQRRLRPPALEAARGEVGCAGPQGWSCGLSPKKAAAALPEVHQVRLKWGGTGYGEGRPRAAKLLVVSLHKKT